MFRFDLHLVEDLLSLPSVGISTNVLMILVVIALALAVPAL